MKKFLLVLMAILLALSLIACDDEETPSSTGSSGADSTGSSVTDSTGDSGTTDSSKPSTDDEGTTDSSSVESNPGDDNPDENPGGEEGNTTGLVLTQAVMKQLEAASTLKLEFGFDVILKESLWHDDGWAKNEKTYFEGIADFTAYISKTENGYNLKLEADVRSRDTDNGEFLPDLNGGVLYIVDGVVYEYNEALDVYLVSNTTTIDTSKLEGILQALIEEAGLSEEEVNGILNELGNLLIDGFGIANNKGSSYVDFKPQLDEALEYLKGIDLETKTLREFINDILASIDEELTVESLLEYEERVYNMTLSEYLAALDEELVAEYGMTLEEIYSAIISNEAVQMIIAEYILSMDPEATEEEIQATIDMLLESKLSDMIPEEMMDETIYDIIIKMLTGEDGGDDGVILMSNLNSQYPSVEELMATIEMYLDMTLAEFDLEGINPFEVLVELAKSIVIDKLDTSLDIEFTGIFKIKTLTAQTNLGLTVTTPSEVNGKKDVSSISVALRFALAEISKEQYPIYAPTDKDEIANVFDKNFYSEDGLWLSVVIDEEEKTIYLEVYDLVQGTGMESVIFAEPTVGSFDGYEIKLTTEQINYFYDSEIPLKLTFTLYPEVEYFEMEYEMCEHMWSAWEEYEELPGYAIRQCVVCGGYDYMDLTVYYTITYHNMDGVENPNPEKFTSDDEMFSLLSPTRDGYLFEGWYFDEEFDNEAIEIDPSIGEDIELYAKWTKIEDTSDPGNEPDATSKWSGQTLNVLATNWNNSSTPSAPWSQVELVVHHGNYSDMNFSTSINSSVIEREAYIKEQYGVEINWINARSTQISTILSDAIVGGGGDTVFHIAMPRMMETQIIVNADVVYDLSKSEYINLDASYYSQAAREAYTVKGVTLFAAGDFSFLDEHTAGVLYYNQAMADEIDNFPDLYQMVREGKWTIDEMVNVAKLVTDETGTQMGDDGVYGFGTTDLSKFYQYSGIKQVSIRGDKYVLSLNDTRVDTLIDKILTINNAGWSRIKWDGAFNAVQTAFEDGRLLFYNEVVQKLDAFGGFTSDFKPAILPMPKLDTDQASYYTPTSYQAVVMCIPKATDDREMSEFFFEVLSYTGQEFIMRAYNQTLLSKLYYGNAYESKEMLEEYIFPGIVYDVGYMHSWSGVMNSVQYDSYSSGKNNFTMAYEFAEEDALKTVAKWNSNWELHTD